MSDDFKEYRNKNVIFTEGWSNLSSKKLYEQMWKDHPKVYEQYSTGMQCLSCEAYADFNADWGLCKQKYSNHYLETIFEHFTCEKFIQKREGVE